MYTFVVLLVPVPVYSIKVWMSNPTGNRPTVWLWVLGVLTLFLAVSIHVLLKDINRSLVEPLFGGAQLWWLFGPFVFGPFILIQTTLLIVYWDKIGSWFLGWVRA